MKKSLERRLAPMRARIDELDDRILELLNERARLALEIGDLKTRDGVSIYAPDRETEILERVAARSGGPLTAGAARRLFERIIDESRSLERVDKATKDATPDTDKQGRG